MRQTPPKTPLPARETNTTRLQSPSVMMKNLTGVFTNCFVASMHIKKKKDSPLRPRPRPEPNARDHVLRVLPNNVVAGSRAAWSVTAPAKPEEPLGPTNTSRFPSPSSRLGFQRIRSPFHSRPSPSPARTPSGWNVEAVKSELVRQMEVNRRLLGTQQKDPASKVYDQPGEGISLHVYAPFDSKR